MVRAHHVGRGFDVAAKIGEGEFVQVPRPGHAPTAPCPEPCPPGRSWVAQRAEHLLSPARLPRQGVASRPGRRPSQIGLTRTVTRSRNAAISMRVCTGRPYNRGPALERASGNGSGRADCGPASTTEQPPEMDRLRRSRPFRRTRSPESGREKSSAWYELQPTARSPHGQKSQRLRPPAATSAKSPGGTNSRTGRCFSVGCRY